MSKVLSVKFTNYLAANPNHKLKFDNPMKCDLLEKR